jgi:hypothetical protein
VRLPQRAVISGTLSSAAKTLQTLPAILLVVVGW